MINYPFIHICHRFPRFAPCFPQKSSAPGIQMIQRKFRCGKAQSRGWIRRWWCKSQKYLTARKDGFCARDPHHPHLICRKRTGTMMFWVSLIPILHVKLIWMHATKNMSVFHPVGANWAPCVSWGPMISQLSCATSKTSKPQKTFESLTWLSLSWLKLLGISPKTWLTCL
jgi:hypothetical protein